MKKVILPAALAMMVSVMPLAPSAIAQTPTPTAAPAAQAGQTILTVMASDQKKVVQDLLVASLRFEVENKDARKVQDDINKAMKTALDNAKAEAALKVSTGAYYVYQYDPNPAPPKPLSAAEMQKRQVWKGSQSIEIKSKDAEKVLNLVSKLQEMGFAMNGLNYTLSPELMEAQKDELIVGALKKVQSKAELVTKAMGKSSYEILELNVDNSYMPPPMVAMSMSARGGAMAKEADMAAPVAAPAEDDVTLSVTAKVALK